MMSSTGRNKGVLWATSGVAAIVVGLTVYVAVSGGAEEHGKTVGKGSGGFDSASASPSSPAQTYAPPEDWTEPKRWIALARGERIDGQGNPVGFPHSTTGAVSMLAAANNTEYTANRSAAEEQIGIYRSYIAKVDQSAVKEARVKLNGERTDRAMQSQLGYSGKMPQGAYVRGHIIGIKVLKEAKGEVTAWLLGRTTTKAGEAKKDSGAYTRTLGVARWENGDWKIDAEASVLALQAQGGDRPAMAAPGDSAFNSAGWTGMREAS
ncbi:hypothetical protein [Streptomyces lydicus]|uniref:hypothetical protein n=1 Tax=Streptomyces lydicus TaxID=47763 RepID=UPI00379E1638